MNTAEANQRHRARLFVSFFTPALLVCIMIFVHLFQQISGEHLFYYGIEPRTLEGLRGMLFSPFIHADWDHLLSNAVPMILLGSAAIYFYRNVAYYVFFLIWLFDALGVWCFGRYSYHIGASGLIYGLASFLFISGLLRSNKALLALSLTVALLYGGLVWGILPILKHISWEAHLFGLVSGMVLAVVFMRKGPANDPLPGWYYEQDEDESETTAHTTTDLPGIESDQTPDDQKPEEQGPRIIYHFKDKQD